MRSPPTVYAIPKRVVHILLQKHHLLACSRILACQLIYSRTGLLAVVSARTQEPLEDDQSTLCQRGMVWQASRLRLRHRGDGTAKSQNENQQSESSDQATHFDLLVLLCYGSVPVDRSPNSKNARHNLDGGRAFPCFHSCLQSTITASVNLISCT